MKAQIFAIPLVLLMVGCPPANYPDPNPNPEPEDTDLIVDMCTHLQQLGCEEGEDVYNDDLPGEVDVPNQSCADYYTELQEEDFYPVNPKCVLTVKTCDDIEDARARNSEDC